MNDDYEEYSHFRRLHPLTLLYRLIRNIPAIAIPVYFGIVQSRMEDLIYILIFIFLGMFLLPSILLGWYYFSFMISESEIIIRSGIFARKQRNIPLERVQNINVKQDMIQRILGIARIQIETAGDVTSEGVLEFVKLKDADEINRIIRVYQKKIKSPGEVKENDSELSKDEVISSFKSETYNPSETGEVLIEMTNRDVLTYGMIRLRPLFLIYGFWAMSFIGQYQYLNDMIFGYLDETMESVSVLPFYYLVPMILVFVISSILLSWIIDIIWTFAHYYGYRLIRDGNKLFASYGLISKYSVTIPLKKLQQITISTNPVKKKFNFYTMTLQTAGFDLSKKSVPAAIPLAKKEILEAIIGKIYPVLIPDDFKSISKKSIRRAFIRYMVLLLPVFAGLYFVFDIYILVGLVVLPGLYYAAFLRWQFRGYTIREGLIFVKQGFWIQKINIIPVGKIQTLHVRETFFQRRLGLATVYIDTASSFNLNDAAIPDIDTDIAIEIMDDLNNAFNNSYKSNTI